MNLYLIVRKNVYRKTFRIREDDIAGMRIIRNDTPENRITKRHGRTLPYPSITSTFRRGERKWSAALSLSEKRERERAVLLFVKTVSSPSKVQYLRLKVSREFRTGHVFVSKRAAWFIYRSISKRVHVSRRSFSFFYAALRDITYAST